MASFCDLPLELIHVIANVGEWSYKALALSYPLFARNSSAEYHKVCFGHAKSVTYHIDGDHDTALPPPTNYRSVQHKYERRGRLHRIDGFAYCHQEGPNSYTRGYFRDGLVHRTEGPAVIKRNSNRIRVAWVQNDVLHRTNGPAKYELDSEGVLRIVWCVYGEPTFPCIAFDELDVDQNERNFNDPSYTCSWSAVVKNIDLLKDKPEVPISDHAIIQWMFSDGTVENCPLYGMMLDN